MVNRTILQGRLCSDPELRRTNSGTAVCSFRVAWSEKVKDRENEAVSLLRGMAEHGRDDLQALC